MVTIEADVGNVAADLRAIDPRLWLRYSEAGEYFVVYLNEDGIPGNGHLVLTAEECDQRIVNRVREIASPDYDYAAEMDKQDAEAERNRQHEFSEQIGEGAERLAHAMRKDLGVKLHAVVPDYPDDAA